MESNSIPAWNIRLNLQCNIRFAVVINSLGSLLIQSDWLANTSVKRNWSADIHTISLGSQHNLSACMLTYSIEKPPEVVTCRYLVVRYWRELPKVDVPRSNKYLKKRFNITVKGYEANVRLLLWGHIGKNYLTVLTETLSHHTCIFKTKTVFLYHLVLTSMCNALHDK